MRNTIVQLAKQTKDKRLIYRLAALAKRYKSYNSPEDLDKLEALLRTHYPNLQMNRRGSTPSEVKDGFIDYLVRLAESNSPRISRKQTLIRYLKR